MALQGGKAKIIMYEVSKHIVIFFQTKSFVVSYLLPYLVLIDLNKVRLQVTIYLASVRMCTPIRVK